MQLFTPVRWVRFRILWQSFKHYKSVLTHKPVCTLLHIQHICSTNNMTFSSSVSLVLQGLSTKTPNNLNKSFSHLFWSYWALSASKYSFPHFIQHSQRFFPFWKHSWNASFGILRSSASQFSLISSMDSKSLSFEYRFQLGEEKEVRLCKVWRVWRK